jgi:hypothetical protein
MPYAFRGAAVLPHLVDARELATHQRKPDFLDALPGFFRTDAVSRLRMQLVKERLAQLPTLTECSRPRSFTDRSGFRSCGR